MSHSIRLLPSGRTFRAETQETVLEAALRSGVDLPYNCAAGSCGECKARLVSGEVARVDFHEYPLSEAEKLRGVTLLCSLHAGSDLVVEVEDAAEIPHQHIEARVAARHEAGHTLLLQLRTPRTRTLRFRAGQYVGLSLPGGRKLNAAIGSCPCNGMLLQFHLQTGPRTEPVRALLSARVGSLVEVEGPYGSFTLDEDSDRAVVMVAEGNGFAPIKSLIEHYIALDKPQPLQLFWLAESGGHYLANQCRAWSDALDGFEYALLTAPPAEAAERIASVAEAGADWYVAASGALDGALAARLGALPHIRRYAEG